MFFHSVLSRWSRLAALLSLFAAPGVALAQNAVCDRLRTDLQALEQAGGRSQPYTESVRRQKADLDRTIAYARSIGCQKSRIPFFGDSAPAQCGSLEAQINRLESNLAVTQEQAQRGAGQVDAQRAALSAAFDAQCRGTPTQARAPAPQPGFLERLFGVVPEQDPYQEPDQPIEPGPADPLVGGSFKTLCVRKCDGYYFPISQRTTRARIETDTSLCQASCPNAEVQLFLQPSGQEAEAAVAADGTPYTSLPNAFRYRKAVDPSCTCRRPGQSWVDTLADAERMIGDNGQDTIVTEQRAQELSRAPDPAKAKAPPPAKAPAKGGKQAGAAAPAVPAPLPPPPPTASSESSGIGGSGQTKDKTLRENQGEKRTVATPDGKKTVRVVAPTLGPALLDTPQ